MESLYQYLREEHEIYIESGRDTLEAALPSEEVQKALKVMGYPTHAAERNGKTYLLPGEKQPESTKTLREEWKMARLEEQKEAASRLF